MASERTNAHSAAATTSRHEPERVHVLIVGSGYAGAIAALRFAQAGIGSVLLERGREWPITPQGDTFATPAAPDGRASWLNATSPFTDVQLPIYTGVLEAFYAKGIIALAGAGVGGGSLVNSAVLIQPSAELFEQTFGDQFSYRDMVDVWYPRVRALLGASPMPDDVLASGYYTAARSFRTEALDAGLPHIRCDMDIAWPVVREEMAGTKVPSVLLGYSTWGVNSGAKCSVDRTILASALATGRTEVRRLSRVVDIRPAGSGYDVGYERIDTAGTVLEHRTIRARHVVLAAGSLGTTRLLVRARATGALPDLAESVGTQWGNNGDNVSLRTGMAYNNPTQGGPSGIVVQDWTDNPIAPVTLLNFPWAPAPEGGVGAIGTLGLTLSPAAGRFDYDSATDEVTLTWPDTDPDVTATTAAVNATLDRLNAVDPGATTEFTAPTTTSHAVGGVPVGAACRSDGRVHGYRNLYVIDSALQPGSCGVVPPALTTAAIADRLVSALLTEIADDSRSYRTERTGS